MKKIGLFVSVLLLVASSAFAEIHVGGLFATTGHAAYLGTPEKDSLEMAVDMINESGGINGQEVKLTVYNTQGDINRTINYYKRLITRDKVDVVIGPTISATTLALKPLSVKYKIPLISCAASKDVVEVPNNEYVFKTAQSDLYAVQKMYSYMNAQGIKNVGIMSSQDSFGTLGREVMLAEAEEWGISIVADEKFQNKDKDMSTQLNKIKNASPDAVIAWGVGPAPAIIAKNARQLGIDNIYMSHGVASMTFVELAGSSGNGIIFPAGRMVVHSQLPKDSVFKPPIDEYVVAYEDRYNVSASPFGGHAYDAMMLYRAAYEMNDGKDIVKSMESLKNFYGVSGVFNITKDDHDGLKMDSFVMVQIEDGAFKLISE